jgi:AcrR family transcriptional regulator
MWKSASFGIEIDYRPAPAPALINRLSVCYTRLVARTVNVEAHRMRREAFLDVAQRLIQTKGYEQMSIQDVLDNLETSRGAFYHYFDSKQALLEAVIDRFADAGLATIEPILADTNLPALRKLEKVFGGIARFKAEQKELVMAIIEVWNSDANALVRESLRRLTTARMVPLLTPIFSLGIEEGLFDIESPEEAAVVIVALMQGFQELAVEQVFARRAGTLTFEVVERTAAAFTDALERILGIPTGSLTLMDHTTLHFWFG